jgi:hypothetical protein
VDLKVDALVLEPKAIVWFTRNEVDELEAASPADSASSFVVLQLKALFSNNPEHSAETTLGFDEIGALAGLPMSIQGRLAELWSRMQAVDKAAEPLAESHREALAKI